MENFVFPKSASRDSFVKLIIRRNRLRDMRVR